MKCIDEQTLGEDLRPERDKQRFYCAVWIRTVCGGRVAERLERWTRNSEAPSSSPAPDVSNFELDLFSVVPSSNPPPSGSEKIAPSWAPMRLKI